MDDLMREKNSVDLTQNESVNVARSVFSSVSIGGSMKGIVDTTYQNIIIAFRDRVVDIDWQIEMFWCMKGIVFGDGLLNHEQTVLLANLTQQLSILIERELNTPTLFGVLRSGIVSQIIHVLASVDYFEIELSDGSGTLFSEREIIAEKMVMFGFPDPSIFRIFGSKTRSALDE